MKINQNLVCNKWESRPRIRHSLANDQFANSRFSYTFSNLNFQTLIITFLLFFRFSSNFHQPVSFYFHVFTQFNLLQRLDEVMKILRTVPQCTADGAANIYERDVWWCVCIFLVSWWCTYIDVQRAAGLVGPSMSCANKNHE